MALGLQLGLAGGGGAATLYGLWFDGSNDKVLFDGSPFNTKTKGRITGKFQTTGGAINTIVSFTDETDVASGMSVTVNAGKLQFFIRQASQILNGKTVNDTFDDGLPHTFDVAVTASGNVITVDGAIQSMTYAVGTASTVAWLSNIDNVDRIAVGVRPESVPEWFFADGVARDIKLYDEDNTTLLWSVNGYGNTDADWLDKGTGNFGMWFDGSSNEVCLGNSAAFNYTTDLDFTVTFVTPSPATAQTLLAKGHGSGATSWAVDISSGNLRFFGYTSGSSVRGIVSGGPAVVANTLYNARFTFDGTTWKIFVDGVEEESVTSAGTLRTNTEDVCIGSRNGASSFLDGTIRDVVVKIDGALVGTWNGYGNTNADWEDQVGSNDGTVAGSPSRAVSTATGWREANDGTVSGSPSRAVSVNGGTTWAEET